MYIKSNPQLKFSTYTVCSWCLILGYSCIWFYIAIYTCKTSDSKYLYFFYQLQEAQQRENADSEILCKICRWSGARQYFCPPGSGESSIKSWTQQTREHHFTPQRKEEDALAWPHKSAGDEWHVRLRLQWHLKLTPNVT